jgi:hypothetical protein
VVWAVRRRGCGGGDGVEHGAIITLI